MGPPEVRGVQPQEEARPALPLLLRRRRSDLLQPIDHRAPEHGGRVPLPLQPEPHQPVAGALAAVRGRPKLWAAKLLGAGGPLELENQPGHGFVFFVARGCRWDRIRRRRRRSSMHAHVQRALVRGDAPAPPLPGRAGGVAAPAAGARAAGRTDGRAAFICAAIGGQLSAAGAAAGREM